MQKRLIYSGVAVLLALGGVAVVSPAATATPLAAAPAPESRITPPKPPPASGKGRVGTKDLPNPPKGTGSAAGDKAARGISNRNLTACGGTACYYYSSVGQTFTDPATSNSYFLSIHKPQLALGSGYGASQNNWHGQSDAHTLMEVAAQRDSSSGGGKKNTVEIGWTVDRNINPDDKPRLFVATWKDGVFLGYNMDVPAGFVDLSGGVGYSPIGPGGDLTAAIGTSKKFLISWFDNASSGNREGWWVQYNSLYVGYFPQSVYSGETFVDMDGSQGFGEIAAYQVETCTDMGNGSLAAAGVGATVSNYGVGGSTDTPDTDEWTSVTQPTWWAQNGTTTIYIGGPGHNSIGGTTAGTALSCGPNTPGTPAAASFQFWQEHAPDNTTMYPSSGGTGASNMVSYTLASIPIGTCTQLLNWGTRETWAVHNNASSSGKTIELYSTSNCTGTVLATLGNQVKYAFAAGSGREKYNVRTFKRTA